MAAQTPPEPAAQSEASEPATEAAPAEPVRHDDLIARIRELLTKYPEIGSRQLYDLAVRMHPDIEQGGWRSFHARYVLPLKRERARAEGRMPKRRERKPAEKPARKAAAGSASKAPAAAAPAAAAQASAEELSARRGRVRDVLLRLARQVAIAESRAELVDALARVEEMVDEVLHAMTAQESPAPATSSEN